MGAHSLIAWIIIGVVAGWLAGLLVKGGGFGLIGPGMGLREEAGDDPGAEPRLPGVRDLLPREQPQEGRLP